MLVLSRQRDEQIVIGDKVVLVMVLSIRGARVRLLIQASTSLGIMRAEKVSYEGERPIPQEGGNGSLVLSRKKGEKILIGDHFDLTVVEVRGDKVRIGIDAPTDVPVHRMEVYKAIHAEEQED